MKKLIAISCLAALLLAGCGIETEEESFSSPEKTTAASEGASAQAETDAPAEETTAAEETTEAGDVSAGGIMDMYPAIYQEEVSRVWNETAGANNGLVSVDYALRDLDGNGVPELLLKHGTCEADFMTDIYTVNDMGELTNVGLLGGSHAVFAYDETSGDLVILSGHMGIGSLRWFRMENGAVSETNEVSFEIAENETYDDYMEKNNVAYMEFVSAFNTGEGETESYLYHNADDFEKYSGLYLDYIK